MKKLFFIIVIAFINIYSHNEFYSAVPYPRTVYDPFLATVWPSYADIPLDIDFETTGLNAIPTNSSYLSVEGCYEDARNVYGQYESNSSATFTEYTLHGVRVHFSNDPTEFLNLDDLADLHPFVNTLTNEWLVDTYIVLNNLGTFKFVNGENIYQSGYYGHRRLRTVLLHEFGHLLSLQHCSGCGSTVMAAGILPMDSNTPNLTTLQTCDITGLNAVITDINDYIWVTVVDPDYPFNINYPYISRLSRQYVDIDPPTGVSHWNNWQIKALTTCGEILVWESSSSNVTIPPLSNGYQYLRDINGKILAKVYTSCVDNDGDYHENHADILIGNDNNVFPTYGTLNCTHKIRHKDNQLYGYYL